VTALPRTPSFKLNGRRALVTGASRGLGLAGAAALAEANAHVVMVSRNKEELEAGVQAVKDAGGSAEALVLDVTDLTSVAQLVADAGPFNILFNNAGASRPKPMLEMSVQDYDHVMDLNLRAAYFVAKSVVQGMVTANIGGSIIHTSSQMGHVGGIDRTVYAASKHAIEGLTKSMAIELGTRGIRVNSIGPTFIRTPLTESTLNDPERKAWIMKKIKLDRMGEVEDIMGAVLFLASDASAMVTGTCILIDGGWTAE
jgi:NAD(P)-dependent dehydrogenase (short-subunit alcohol dehydrogenase family)